MLSIGICGLVIASTVVLSLIPLYTPPSEGVVSTKGRTRSFQYKFNYNRVAKRSLSSGLDPVDASSFQELNHLIRSILTKRTHVPISVAANVEQAFLDATTNVLYVGGFYTFSLFCNTNCQDQILDRTFVDNSTTQKLRNLSITNLNEQLQLSIRQNIYHFGIIDMQIAPDSSEVPIDLSYDTENAAASRRRRRRRELSLHDSNDSLTNLVQQTLWLTADSQNIPFVIASVNSLLSSSVLQLNVSVILQYPFYCVNTCLTDHVGALVSDLSNLSRVDKLQYQYNNSWYRVIMLKTIPSENYALESERMFTYEINGTTGNTSAIVAGPINDANSLDSIKAGLNATLNSSIDFVVVGASFRPIDTSPSNKLLDLSLKRGLSRRKYGRYQLIVIIRFIFLSLCDRHCQKLLLTPIFDHRDIPPPPAIMILGIKFKLPKPIIEIWYKPSPSLTTTTTVTSDNTPTESISTDANTFTEESSTSDTTSLIIDTTTQTETISTDTNTFTEESSTSDTTSLIIDTTTQTETATTNMPDGTY
ncbi:unnamed protein product [Adineta ricciae]|uniref:Uncharacterized protein n=1 Tax=Adineta ricciae TaxID=249248 RepID=A0A814HET4_ADIRI|nr:unnamed protein product [Adineta ricciae]